MSNTESINLPQERELTDEEIAAFEAERMAAEEKRLEPYKTAAMHRNEALALAEEHDATILELLYQNALSSTPKQ